MAHSVQLIIGRGEPVAAFLQLWPVARAVDLREGWQAVPVDAALREAIEAAHPGAERPPELDLSPFGLEGALAAATRSGGGLAYVETEYFGGAGEQSATAYIGGQEVMAPQRSRGGGGPINQALQVIGVVRTVGNDAFDTIGLGERRSMSDYEPEGPVRQRPPPQLDPSPEADKAYVPLWKVVLAIAALIAVGVFMSFAF